MNRFTWFIVALLLVNIWVTFVGLQKLIFNDNNWEPPNEDTGFDVLHGGHVQDTNHQAAIPQGLSNGGGINVDTPTHSRNVIVNNTPIEVRSSDVNVLILASMRTGSSFVGELFKQNSDFLYMFEPLRGLNLQDSDPMLPVLGVEMLTDIYNCNFSTPTTKAFLNKLYNVRIPVGREDVVRAWVNDRYCTGWDKQYNTFHWCPNMTPDMAREACQLHKYTVIKAIRLYELNLLVHLMIDPDVELKIINVLRDPRAMMGSVMPIASNNYKSASKAKTRYMLKKEHLKPEMLERLNIYCTSSLRNYLLGTKGKWIPKKRYLPLRYEDMAADPHRVAQQVYDFLGAELPANVTRWINQNTKEDVKGDHGLYAYTTKRNSKEAAESWRHRMTFELVEAIEKTGDCARFMDVLGYRNAKSNDTLHDMSISFFS